MKRIIRLAAVGAVALCLGLSWSANANAAEQKIATIDLQKVFEKYYKTVLSTTALKQEAADMQKERKDMIEAAKKQDGEWQKLLEKADDPAVSADERAKSKKAAADKLNEVKAAQEYIQQYDQTAGSKLREKERLRRDDIVKEIRTVLDADAKAAGYTMVLDVSGESANMAPVVLYSNGANDLTDNLIKELNAGARSSP